MVWWSHSIILAQAENTYSNKLIEYVNLYWRTHKLNIWLFLFFLKNHTGVPGWLSRLSAQLLISTHVMTSGSWDQSSPCGALHSAWSRLENLSPSAPLTAHPHVHSLSNWIHKIFFKKIQTIEIGDRVGEVKMKGLYFACDYRATYIHR